MPDSTTLPVATPQAVRRALAKVLVREKRVLVGILALYLVAAAGGVAIPVALGFIIDGIASGWGSSDVDLLCAALVAGIMVQLVASRHGLRMSDRYGERAAAQLRETTLERALHLPLGLIEQAGLGDVTTRTTGDVAAVAHVLRHTGPTVVAALIELLALLMAAFVVSPILAPLLLIMVVPLTWAGRVYTRSANPAFARERRAMAEIAETVSASEAGARTIAAHGLSATRERIGSAAIGEHRRGLARIVDLQTWFLPTLDLAHIVPVVAVLVGGGLWSLSSGVGVGPVVACAMIAYRVAGPVERVMYSLSDIQSASAAMARIEGLGTVPVETRTKRTEHSRITLHDVQFGYGTGPVVLSVRELDIPPRSRVVVVGRSGSGKSTLARLIAGIESAREGSVLIGGVAAETLELDCLRSRVALMTQEAHAFDASLRDNLTMRHPVPDTELLRALERVGADWATDLDAVVGGDGPHLTAAQKQELSLARALVANPDVVIFDESFSALDALGKENPEAGVFDLMPDSTVLVIAHQLDMVSSVTRIIMMDEGRIVQDGTHAHLLATEGPYAHLWRSWQAEPDPG
ncbi:ABC transporter ATP-binding protein [Arachnia propionica]|uniref:ABC transporter ATP-binding protein n=1 Tax=Arachnia propionica TaxID=1750 RepID=A0A3P1WR68_9ACTN|nr:ABC transporter ATP-binding protein [Arachnia propionica]RRD48456.1 ABC transporter ATP-binding protein [Arachnia propionica]